MAIAETTPTSVSSVGVALGKTMREVSPQVEKSVESVTYDMGKRAGEVIGKVSEKAVDYYASSRDYVSQNPVKGVAIAASVGVAAGCLLTLAMVGRKH